MNVFLTHPVVHCMNLYQTTQLQHSPQCRKSCTLCRFKCKVRVLIYLLRLHFCSGEVAQQQLLLTQHETHTKIMLCLWLSSCLHETKSHWESADIVSANQNTKNRGNSMVRLFFPSLPSFLPSLLPLSPSVVCPETFPSAFRGRNWVWTQLSTKAEGICTRSVTKSQTQHMAVHCSMVLVGEKGNWSSCVVRKSSVAVI